MEFETKVCPHRYEVTFNLTVVGIGEDKDEAFEDALEYIKYDMEVSDQTFDLINIVEANDMDSCYLCEE